MTENFNRTELELVIARLSHLHESLETLMQASSEPKNWPLLQGSGELAVAKKAVKDAARERFTNRAEQCFLDPGVRRASANFRLRADAHPRDWVRGLYEPSSDLSYYLFNAREALASLDAT